MTGVVHAAAQGWFESLRLAWGAWLSSSGAGILGAIVAALGAYVGIGRKAMDDRRNAEQSARDEAEKDRIADARQRWWEAYNHLWANRNEIQSLALVEGVRSLGQVAETVQQSLMAEVFLQHIIAAPRQRRR